VCACRFNRDELLEAIARLDAVVERLEAALCARQDPRPACTPEAASVYTPQRVPEPAEPEDRDDELDAAVLEYLREHGPASGKAVRVGLRRRKSDVLAALRRLAATGAIVREGGGWSAA
jgi:hypothetical protein